MNYPDSVEFLYSLGNEVKTAKLGLERIRAVLHALGNPERSCASIHVAGTNGKGSTCAMIEAALRAAGYRTGLFTSPHLVEPTERIQLAGRQVDKEAFATAFDVVHQTAEELLAQGGIDLHPTYFETVTAMAFWLFREMRIDYAVVEVGLGGRLDATNVIQPQLAVITPIDYDHEAWLGHRLEQIAAEKAGILKPGIPAVIAPQQQAARAVIDERARLLGSPLTYAESYPIGFSTVSAYGSSFDLQLGDDRLRIRCPLAGEHQVQNARTAAIALHLLGLSGADIVGGLARTRWPGRLERVAQSPDIILDGAHNPAGVRALAAYIARFFPDRPVWLIYGAMRDKALGEIAEILFPLAQRLIFTRARSPRAVDPQALAQLTHQPSVCTSGVEEALQLVRTAPEDAVVFISGSLYIVGEARALLCAGT